MKVKNILTRILTFMVPIKCSYKAFFAIIFTTFTLFAVASTPSSALEPSEAELFIGRIVAEVNEIISANEEEEIALQKLESVFERYADINIMALTTLGVARRAASSEDLDIYKGAFKIYFLDKYAKRFRELKDGNIEVVSARKVKSYVEVRSIITMMDWAPFDVIWLISDRSGPAKIFNIVMDGISLLAFERTEIGVMLENRGGNIKVLSEALRNTNYSKK
ncbi:MAG: phospholipid transport system substrate-binding protein [Paracoccaceae bacterium]|jgi:phospholipid transport system substrate-binding protein